MAQYNPRGTDVSVVHDLMIHDIDLALHLVGTSIKRISASGARVVSETADIATARLEFQNGATALLTTSRVAFDNRRRVQIFEADGYYDLDLLHKTAHHYALHPTEAAAKAAGTVKTVYATPAGTVFVGETALPVAPINAIRQELIDFAQAVKNRAEPPVPLVQAADALRAVEEIVSKL
jgi:predicted dehydrogenase